MHELFTRIEQRYAFSLPQAFREFWSRGWCTITDHRLGPNYLLLPDMDWMPLEQIADFPFEPYHLPGFVPFATTAGGDLWCWQPAFTDARGTRVLSCPHDCYDADIFAPDFVSAVCRHLVDEAACMHPDPASVEEYRQLLLAVASQLEPFLSSFQQKSLAHICQLPVQHFRPPAIRPTDWYFLLPSPERTDILRS